MSPHATAVRTIGVDLAGRSYDIAIGPGLIDRAGLELTLHHASPARAEPLRMWLEAALE